MPRRNNRRQARVNARRGPHQSTSWRWSSVSRPPSWYRRHEDATPCDCPIDAETIRTATGYSDFGYFLRECPACGHKWAAYIEG